MSKTEDPNATEAGRPTSDQASTNARSEQPPEADEDVIEGGTITLSPQPVSWKDRHESETAKVLTFALVGILAGSLLIHYVAVSVLLLNGQKETVDVLTTIFDKWLPVISSFVGGAVTFYLTRKKG